MRGLLLSALLWAPAPALAAYPDCLVDPATRRPREDFQALRDCQAKARGLFAAKRDKKGRRPGAAALEAFDDHQRAEAKRFFENPQAEAVGGGTTLVDSDSPAAAAAEGEVRDKLGGLTDADRARAGAGAKDLLGLEGRLKAAAGDGSKGITPAMARDIIATLKAQQGGVSGDMQGLLDSVVRDGGKLKPETMKKLQDAARSAKGAGLQLGIDPKIEQGLLESDFSGDKVPASPGAL
ncbi:MAG: hypothetical protein SF051_02955 [Elusimicrobiota bacterium]|nr:hypothetical protein [Elusimicrobiota bacterium]